MRPQSEIRVCLAAALLDGAGTSRELAQRTGWAYGLTMRTLDNMAKAGDVRKRYTRVPGVCRPVPVYERAVRAADDAANDSPLQSLIAAWMGAASSSLVRPMEAAM